MRILLVSTYELGHQPLHVASPAGALLREGHEVRCLDLSVEALDLDDVRWADAVACSVPMHTAARIAIECCRQIRASGGALPLCMYGLYAHLASESVTDGLVDLAISGEYEPRLVRWAAQLGHETTSVEGGSFVELGRGSFGLPARELLPPLESYARLSAFGETQLAGYVEASHGCAHRCRHCPVPVIYDGRTRLVGADSVVADVAQLVDLGARHITFGDPDFLNGPHHSARVVSAVHGAFPGLTFDVTAKVEHVIAHADLWTRLHADGCLFVVSAFESTSREVLGRLDKGHSAGDEREAVRILRSAGIEPRPSFLPFTPWTTTQDVVDLLDLVAECDLVGNVDPVQFAIRLLVPPGSLLVTSGALDGHLGRFDPERLSWTWNAPDARLDELAARLGAVAERAGHESWPAQHAYRAVRDEVFDVLELNGTRLPPVVEPRMRSGIASDERPRLTEAWFCCAEPTHSQLEVAQQLEPAVARGL